MAVSDKRHRLWTGLLLAATLVGCKGPTQESTELFNAIEPPREMALFRSLFHAEIAAQAGSRAEFDRTVLLPTKEVITAPSPISSDAFFDSVAKQYARLKPELLHRAAVEAPIDESLATNLPLASKPITFILVPGVFGEFIDTKPMSDVFDQRRSSPLKDALKAALANSTNSELTTDQRYDLLTFGQVEQPLSEYFNIATAFDGDRPLYNFISFEMPRLSLESLGNNDEVATIYVRRLRKLFELVPTDAPIYFIGYSRGASVTLAMLDKARHDSWFKNVRGMVALGGVIYGSDLADQSKIPGSKLNKQMNLIKELADSLEVTEGLTGPQRLAAFTRNTGRWERFITKIVALSFTQIIDTVKNYRSVDLGELWFFVKTIWNELNLNNFVSDYSNNIKRFKIIVKAAFEAGDELSTEKRLAWWREHTVPEHLTYYAVTATMSDPKVSGAMARGKLSYDIGSVDYKSLLHGYQDYVEATGFRLNDSQVAVHKSRFWPEIHSSLNPRQAPLKTADLAIFNTHHWALALEMVNQNDPPQKNPFSRAAFMKTLARFLSAQ